MYYKGIKKGISLIVLIITIIVIAILASVVVLSLSQNNPITSGNEAVFKNDLKSFEADLSMYLTEKYASGLGSYNPEGLKADDLGATYENVAIPGKTIKDIIPSLSRSDIYNGQLEVVAGKLVYKGTNIPKKRWAEQINLEVVNGDRLDIVITSQVITPVAAGTDVVCDFKLSSNSGIDKINLAGNIELLDENNVAVMPQPIFQIGLPSGGNTDTLRNVAVTVKTDTLVEGMYKIKLKSGSVSNIYDITNESDIVTILLFEIDNTPPTNPVMSAIPAGWINGNVTVTINYAIDAVAKQYSINGTTWSAYTTPVVVTTNNTTVYARATDISGNQSGQSTITIANIDKVSPIVAFGTNGGANLQIASTTVNVSDIDGSLVNTSTLQYVWDIQDVITPVSGWATFTNGAAITKTGVTGTYYLWIKGSDNTGNSVVSKSNAFGIDVTPPTNPGMSAAPTGWTNTDVTVTITYPGDTTIKEYSTNGTTWNVYTAGVVVTTNNTTVYARATDAAGNPSGVATLTVANIDKINPTITNTLTGSILYTDPKFQSGVNGTAVYNNLGNGTVTNTRVSMADSPTGSGFGMEIKTTGTPSPGWGGFYFATPSAVNKVFITKIIASIPVGYTINWASNAIGDGGTNTWLTSQNGTGTWQEYICKVSCGPSGTFSSTNFYYLTGGTTPTVGSPLIWKVAYATIFDTTIGGATGNVIVSATDTSGITGYGINQSNVTAPTYTNITANTSFSTVFENINVNGTYYVWLKDLAGNVTNSSVVLSTIDSIAPTVIFGTNGASNVPAASTTVTVSDTGGSGLNTSTLQYVWDTQNSTTPGSGWTVFTNGGTISKGAGNGTYYLWIKANDNVGNNVVSKTNAFTVVSVIYNFGYTGGRQTWVVPVTATYKFEVWGSQGSGAGGTGGYAAGNMLLTAGQTIYIYVGGTTGYNGGGAGGTGARPGYTGGGATDMRTVDAIANRVIVAGGGGGSGGNSNAGSPNQPDTSPGGVGGAAHLNGTQNSYAGSGNLGYTGSGSSGGAGGAGGPLASTSSSDGTYYQAGGGGGGGGYYGGGGGGSGSLDGSGNNVSGQSGITGNIASGGAGGNSSYTYGVSGYHSWPGGGGGGGFSFIGTLTNATMYGGNVTFTAPGGGTEVGHTGNGYARITIW